MKELQFPKYKIRYPEDIADEITLMVLGGRAPSVQWLRYLDFYSHLWCADRGVDVCRQAGIVPQRLIGDRDSSLPDDWKWAEDNGALITKLEPDKDLTDFQVALQMFSDETAPHEKGLVLTGAFGGRFDHLWSVLLSFLYWSNTYKPVAIVDDQEALFLIKGGQKAIVTFYELPHAVSLIPFEDSEKVSISGAKWALDGISLEYSKPYSISNRVEHGQSVKISVDTGLVGFYAEWLPSQHSFL